MSSVNWNDFTPVGSPAPVDWSQFEPVKPTGAVRKLADIGVSFAGGAVGATKAIADAGGAGNAVSTKLGAAQDSVQGWLSPARQAEKAARAQIIKNAEQSGSAWNEVAAHLGGIVEAPVSTLAEAAGSVVPVVASMFTPAGRSAAGRTLMGIGVGGAQGAGAVKGGIYDAVQQQHIDRGSTPEAARAAAEEAQAYGGDNTGNIAFGAGLGAVAGTTGVEHLLSRAVGGQGSAGSVLRRLATGAVTEGVPEAIQGGQERYAANVAQQRAGFDVPTWQGVVGQATAEGVAGGMLGGVTGAASRARRAAQPEAQAAAQQPVTETPAPREQFEDVPDIDPSAGPLSKAASMAGSLSLAPREPAPVPVDPRSALEAVADRLPEQGQRAARMTLADLARDDLPAGVRAMREIEARELAAAAPAPEPEVSDMQPGRVLRTFDARTDEAPPTRLGLMPDESVRAQAGIDFTPTEPAPAPPNAFAEQINRLALDSDLTPGAPLRLNEAHALRSQAIDAGVPASVVPHPSGRGYDVQPSVRLSPEQRAVTPQTKPGLLGLDDGPSGRMIAGGDTVRHETRAEATARRNALETERQAVDAERERRTALGLSIGARAAPAAVNDATSAALAPGATAAPAVPAARPAGVEAAGVAAGQAPQAAQQPQARAPGQRLGRDSVPIEEGGKAFKTKRAAAEAKKLQPMMRVVSVDGGYALAEKTPAQLAAEAKAARRLSVARAGTAGMPIAAHEFIATNGGLSRDVAADLGVEGNPRIGNRTLYAARGKGMSLERATEALSQAGYIEDGDQGAALDIIRRSLTQPQYTADGWQQIAQAEDKARFEDHLAAQQEEAAAHEGDPAYDPFAPDGFIEADMEPGVDSLTPAEHAEFSAYLAAAESEDIDVEAALERAAMLTDRGTQQEFQNAARKIIAHERATRQGLRQPDAGEGAVQGRQDAERQGARTGEQDAGQSGAARGQDEGLSAYTEADLKARDAERQQADAAAQRDKQEQDQRAKADAERGDFTLTGSDRPADEAEARGQRGMFDGNSKTEPTDEPTTIQDFGEKIGGARKDTATKTSRAAPKPKDDRPAWARRFSIGQATKSSTPGEEGRWFIRDERSTDWTGQARITGDRKGYATREEAEQAIPLIAVAQKHRAVPAQDGKYEIWRTISDKKRVKVIDRVFDTRDDAMRYMAENPVEIIEANTTFGEADLPRPDSEQRTGVARRMGPAKDADFMSTFGFRGVEFGNWQNQTERQQLLDDAYDGLLDLAEVMGIPPKAIGLNGDLALAFGARGHGLSGARAHYEPARVVINLTKMNGAGSLAHEWLHALDHYLARQDGKASSEWVLEKDGTRTLKVGDDSMASGGFSYGDRSGVRQELREAFAHVLQTMSKKAQQYVQDTAKADEFVGKARDDVQTKLARIRADLSSHNEYAKRNNKPATAEQLADFDTLAEQITQGRALETSLKATSDKKDAKGRVPLSGMRWTNDALDGLSAIIKAVRGRSGFNAEHQGELDRLRTSMDFYSQRLKMLADAQQGEEKTRMVPTEFAMNAKELDQGRGKDYWTTPHEMAARAFQGYVEDKIAERGAVSPFLNHAPENVGIPTPWGWKRPYPHGAERKAINAAFDKLVGTIKTRDTEKGVEVYAGRRESAQTVGKPTDRAVMDMAREGNSAQDILKLIAGTSRSRFNKQVARLLLKTGTSPDVRFDTADLGGADGFKFKAKYSRAHHAVTLTPAAAGQAEQIVLHELIHAATLAALDRKGMASAQMRRLYEHVKKQGGVAGQYGMKNVGEFVAEVFTNPDFQRSLKDLSAPTGSRLKTAWDSFVRILKGILGIPHDASNALSQALDTGVALMREDMGVRARRAVRKGADAHAGAEPLDAFPASLLAELAAADDLFQNPRSASTTVVGALADIDPSIRFVGDVTTSDERSESGADSKLLFRTAKGSDFFVFERGRQVWIDVSRLGEGDGGSAIYSAAMDYAANTGKQLVGDPAGLSDIAMRRRLEAMISSALKHGSTDHMAPHDRQVSGDEKLGIPALKWQNGDTIGNVQRMIDVSLAALAAHVPEFRRARYDFESRTFRTGEGKPLSDELLHEWASQHPRMRAAGQGRRSIKRGILLNTLAHTAGSERPGLLEQALRQPDQLVGPQAEGIFYAGSPDEDSAYFGSGSDSESPAARRMGDALSGLTVTNLKRLAGFKATDLRPLALQTLGRRQLVDVYGNQLPELKAYSDLMARMDADKNEAGAGADQLANDWAKLPDERALADLMHDATLAQMDPAKEFVPGDNRVQYGALRNRYQALTPAAREVYAKARDSYSEHMSDVRSAIKDRIHRAEMSSQRKAEMLKRLDDEFFGRVKGVYFPLSRFGQYVVVVKDADGKVANVSRAETMAEADSTRRQLAGLFPADKGFAVGKVIKAKDFVADRDAVGRGFMEQLYGVLDKQGIEPKHRAELEDALGQLYLSSLPDLSWAKHGIHRKGTPGFSQDARRAFAQNVFHGASYLAKLRYGDQLQDQLKEMQRRVDEGTGDGAFDSVRAQQVVDEMTKRHEAAMNPKTNALSTALTSIGFMFHLGLSPASAMVNLTQTALVAYPVMGARWGFAKSSAALLKASNEAVRGGNDITRSLSADEKKAFDEAVRSGVIDVTMAHDLAGIAQGEDRNVSWKLQPVMKAASFLFHRAEKFNRQVTFVAAYRLARGAGADAQAAYEQAVQATYDGHFDYSANNRPRVMQGNVARVLLLFKQYSQNMIYTLARNAQQSLAGATPEDRARARKALGGLLTMHALAAGALGLPMVTTLLAAASMLGGDDDEPWDAKVALQNMLADAFGQKPAEVLAHGLSRLTPWDISGRVGLDKLIFPDVQEGLEGQRLAESTMAAALGPVAGIGINALRGAQLMGEGRYTRGLEAMAPSALRGPLKAFRYSNEGVQDKTGIVIQDEVDAAALLGQAAGFSPSDVRNAYEGKAAIVQHDRALQARRRALVERFAMAAMANDDDGKTEAREAIQRFNEKNPNRRILPMQLAQSVRMREKRIREAEDGVFLPKKRRESLEVGRFATGV